MSHTGHCKCEWCGVTYAVTSMTIVKCPCCGGPPSEAAQEADPIGWPELARQYGSQEAAYRAIELGQAQVPMDKESNLVSLNWKMQAGSVSDMYIKRYLESLWR